jgi:hypothetical protein
MLLVVWGAPAFFFCKKYAPGFGAYDLSCF